MLAAGLEARVVRGRLVAVVDGVPAILGRVERCRACGCDYLVLPAAGRTPCRCSDLGDDPCPR